MLEVSWHVHWSHLAEKVRTHPWRIPCMRTLKSVNDALRVEPCREIYKQSCLYSRNGCSGARVVRARRVLSLYAPAIDVIGSSPI